MGIFSITAMIVRNIHHPIFSTIKNPVIFIADLPKELYREFILGKETEQPLLPISVRGTNFEHKNVPEPIIYKYKSEYYKQGKNLGLPTNKPIFYIDPNLKFFYTHEKPEFVKYQIVKNSFVEIWRTKLPYAHHEKYVDQEGYIYLPIYYPMDGSNGEISNAAKKLNKILSKQNSPPYDKTGDNFRDDGVAVISPEGKIVHKIGLSELFSKNNLLQFIYSAGLETDPFHLNSVFPAKKNWGNIKKGDLLLSLRHQSMLLIYRPSTSKIIWNKVGPWSNQHSAKFDNDGKIYLFDNRVIDTHYSRRKELNYIDKKNEILLHDIVNDKTEVVDNCVSEKDFSTVTGGYVLINEGYIITKYSNTQIQVICDLRTSNRIILVPENNASGRVIPGTGVDIIGFINTGSIK